MSGRFIAVYLVIALLSLLYERVCLGYRAEIEPLIWGTNVRDPGVMFADYVFQARVGKGMLLACCLKLSGKENVAGQYLKQCLMHYAANLEAQKINDLSECKILAQLNE